MKRIIVHHRSPHHALKSGYGRLIDFIPNVELVNGKIRFSYRLAKVISQSMSQKAGLYDSRSFKKELELFKLLRVSKSENKVVHYLNAERDIRFNVNRKNSYKNTVFCGTFHKPPIELVQLIKNPTYLKKLDGAIAVGKNQVDFLKDWLQNENVQYIPHGVDTNFFCPGNAKKEGQRILFVGQYLRDFDTFKNVIEILLKKFSQLQVEVVLRKEFVKFIDPHCRITILEGIDDVRLKSLYQKASLLFLPLLDSTACNSILESMACGLPIVTSDVGGNAEYLKGTNNLLIPKSDVDGFVEVITKLLKDPVKTEKMGISTRTKALEYDWGIVAQKVSKFYNEIQD